MPTPSSEPPNPPSPLPFGTSCPDDLPRAPGTWPTGMDEDASSVAATHTAAEGDSPASTMSPRPQSSAATVVTSVAETDETKHSDVEVDGQANRNERSGSEGKPLGKDNKLALNLSVEEAESEDLEMMEDELYSPSMGSDFSSMRAICQSPSSFLRPGSRFHGTQQSERQVYDVQVEIKKVDMRESFLCGYLRIQGLTPDHPTLSTYFEGEIIGSRYNFYTEHDDWGASVKVDLNHWSKFNAFRRYHKQARKGPVSIPDVAQQENIFMRWKEHFLVPDHRVKNISGASFEGFYYICFNQLKGEVSGIYFHSKSEKFQQLELKHIPDRGCLSAIEFR